MKLEPLCVLILCACSSFSSPADRAPSPTGIEGPATGRRPPAANTGVAGSAGIRADPPFQPPLPQTPADHHDDAGAVIAPPGSGGDAGMAPVDGPPGAPRDAGGPPGSPPPPGPEPGTVRFVALVADSEVLGREVACVGDFNLLGADGQTLDRSLWRASASSEEPTYVGGAPASQAIDADPSSLWHTAWFGLDPPPGYPHLLQLDLGAFERITGFRYLPRQDSSSGRIADYRFFVSTDAVDWGAPVAAGTFPNSATEQTVLVVVD